MIGMKIEAGLEEKVRHLFSLAPQTLGSTLGLEWSELSKIRVVGRLPVDARTKQPFGILHGGASVALAESLASVGGWLNIDDKRFAAVGIEINANHVRSVRHGWVIGTAVPLHRGQTTHVWEITIREEGSDKLACVSRCTLAIIEVQGG